MARMSPPIAYPGRMPERDPSPKSAFDKSYDPYYGEAQGEARDGQHVEGHGFAGLRDDMDTRRRQMARRVRDDC